MGDASGAESAAVMLKLIRSSLATIVCLIPFIAHTNSPAANPHLLECQGMIF